MSGILLTVNLTGTETRLLPNHDRHYCSHQTHIWGEEEIEGLIGFFRGGLKLSDGWGTV